MPNDIYQVWLSTSKIRNPDESSKEEVLITNKKGMQILFKIFRTIKNEMSEMNNGTEEFTNIFDKNIKYILNYFSGHIGQEKNLEKIIEQYLVKLKKYEFRSGVSGSSFIKLEDIINDIYDLRKERISHWEAILNEYKRNREAYEKKLEEYKKNF